MDNIEEVMKSGEQLPSEMWEASMSETTMSQPIYDGQKIVETKKEDNHDSA